MKPMKIINAIIIDPATKTVSGRGVVDDLDEWQKIVGGDIEQIVVLPDHDQIYGDENGRNHTPLHWWSLANQPVALCGSAFIVGGKGEEFTEPKMTLAEAQRAVVFIDEAEARRRFAAHEAQRKADYPKIIAAHEKRLGLKPGAVGGVFIEGVFPGDEEK